eukprot:3886717-Rhodomonas_salina.2
MSASELLRAEGATAARVCVCSSSWVTSGGGWSVHARRAYVRSLSPGCQCQCTGVFNGGWGGMVNLKP